MPDIFSPRVKLKPYEYPEVDNYIKSINNSYWLVDHWNYKEDVQDFYVKLNDKERELAKRALLAISQIEVTVKKFWGRLGDRLPKPEFEGEWNGFGEAAGEFV